MQDMLFTFLIPTMISILAIMIQKNEIDLSGENRHSDLVIAQLRRENDDDQMRSMGNETVFSNYIKNMADVILSTSTKIGNQHYVVTRALTITVLRQLDLEKKRLVVLFLYDSGIIHRHGNIFAMNSPTDPPKHLKGAILNNIHCSGGLDLSSILLRSVTLINASFSDSDLSQSDFSNSILTGVNFSGTKLDGTRFINVQLQKTNFIGASVKNIHLIRANLTQSTITDEQISQALFIYDTILPNGTYAKNKSFIINGDARQGLNGWNITSGRIEIKDFCFIGKNNSKMHQRINTSAATLHSSHQIFQYCISLLFYGKHNLMIQLIHLDQNQTIIRVENFIELTSSSCNNTLKFCYWSYCKDSLRGTEFIDLKFIFEYNNYTQINSTNVIAVKDIQFTLRIQ